MPEDIARDYLYSDLLATLEVYEKQSSIFSRGDSTSLIPIRDMMCEFTSVLTDIEMAGMAIDLEALDKVDQDYEAEEAQLKSYLTREVRKYMGDTPINLSSGEQMSKVIYSCQFRDKKLWKEVMNIGTDSEGKPLRRPRMKIKAFREVLSACFTRPRKQQATKCLSCYGSGQIRKIKKSGEPFARTNACQECGGLGVLYKDLPEIAGLGFNPTVDYASEGGFATNKATISELRNETSDPDKRKFLDSIARLSAISSYRTSFINGIRTNTRPTGLLHCSFNQTTTRTGRLSSSGPNMQNIPKDKSFPVRAAFVSRFEDGTILEIDYSQLEFRIAGILANDPAIAADILNGHDVHQYTADVLTAKGEPTKRGPAKSRTFKPLYGGTSGTVAERAYYEEFFNKYSRVLEWHDELLNEAVVRRRIQTPTGRQFDFPNCRRLQNGGVHGATTIKNYPVQSVATADIVPLGVILLHKWLKSNGLRTVLINTVHDSVVLDVHPEEIALVSNAAPGIMLKVADEAGQKFDLDVFIPLDVETSVGKNWLEQKDLC